MYNYSNIHIKVDGISDRSITYGQLRDSCRALAIRLQFLLHLNFGDTVAVCLPNSIEFPIVCLAGNEAGTLVTTVNPIYTAGKTLFPHLIMIMIIFLINKQFIAIALKLNLIRRGNFPTIEQQQCKSSFWTRHHVTNFAKSS